MVRFAVNFLTGSRFALDNCAFAVEPLNGRKLVNLTACTASPLCGHCTQQRSMKYTSLKNLHSSLPCNIKFVYSDVLRGSLS